MSDISDTVYATNGSDRRRGRGVRVAAGLAAAAMLTAACGGGDGAKSGSGAGTPEALTADVITEYTASNVQCPSGTPGQGKPSFTFGSKDFAEQFTLGELYTQALKTRGYNVNYRSNVGGTDVIDQAFKAGQLDAYPDYLGVLETGPVGAPVGKSPEQTYQTAKSFEESKRDATILQQTPFQNTDVLVTTAEFAKKYNLKSIPDLKNVGDAGAGVTLAAQPSFETRYTGVKGMKEVYGLTGIGFIGVDPGLVYQVLKQGQANVVDGFSTDGQLAGGDLVTLDDPENIFGFQYVAPIVKKAVLDAQGPEFAQTLNCVSALLTTKAMQALNREVQVNGQEPSKIAKSFLDANGITAG